MEREWKTPVEIIGVSSWTTIWTQKLTLPAGNLPEHCLQGRLFNHWNSIFECHTNWESQLIEVSVWYTVRHEAYWPLHWFWSELRNPLTSWMQNLIINRTKVQCKHLDSNISNSHCWGRLKGWRSTISKRRVYFSSFQCEFQLFRCMSIGEKERSNEIETNQQTENSLLIEGFSEKRSQWIQG